MVKNRRQLFKKNLCLEFSFAFIAIVPPLNIYNRGNLQIEKRFFWQLHLKNPELINLKHYFIFRAVSSFLKVTFKVRILLGLNLLTMSIKKSLKFYTEEMKCQEEKTLFCSLIYLLVLGAFSHNINLFIISLKFRIFPIYPNQLFQL